MGHAREHLGGVVSSVLSVSRFIAILLLALSFGAQSAAAESVGMVTKVENQAQIGSANAVVGSLVQANDAIRTGPKSRLEISFRDNTKLSVGENATVVIDRFVFNPEQSTGELLLSTSTAAFRMATGRINAMKNKQINVTTPMAALAVRGTDFWWGTVDGQYGTLLVSNSKVRVRDRKGKECEETLDEAGEGADIGRDGCPGAAYIWPPGKVTAALSSTTFGLAAAPSVLPAIAAAAVAGVAAVVITDLTDEPAGASP